MELQLLISCVTVFHMNASHAFVERAMSAVCRAYDTLELPEPERSVQVESIEHQLWTESGCEPDENWDMLEDQSQRLED